MCADCGYAPECYACMVGVATGPESHNPCCSLARCTPPAPVEHRIHTDFGVDRASWECSCGCGGSAAGEVVDFASDKHVDRERGDRRVDVSRPFD